jgi:hypothetical protein
MIPREETEVVNTKKDDGHGNDEEDDYLNNSMTMVIMKMYNANNFCNIKWIVQRTGAKGKSWVFFLLDWIVKGF